MVEFALIAPVVMLVMLGIISFGLLLSWRSMLDDAARAGARAGAVCKTDDEVKKIVTDNCSLLPHANTVSVSVTETDFGGAALPPGSRQRGGVITVTLTYTANVIPIPGILVSQRPLLTQATFRMECDS